MAAVQSAYSSSLLLQCSTSVDQKSSSTSSSSRLSLRSSFAGAKVRVGRVAVKHCSVRQSSSLQIMAVTKKAVAVLKGTTDVSGTVTLVQEDEGKEAFEREICALCPFSPWGVSTVSVWEGTEERECRPVDMMLIFQGYLSEVQWRHVDIIHWVE
jgi:hypothetical protein